MSRSLKMVAIGASAGGLESLERLFDGITSAIDVSFVVIQHLSPNYETMMDHLLARHTFMPVTIAKHGQLIEKNHVYVIPPKMDMTVQGSQLLLCEQDAAEIPHLPIDRFFNSMAGQFKQHCAAVVLSGTGADGSIGIRAVRSSGGIVLCESESTAKFTGMPRSAYATGCVDYLLPPEAIGESLVRLASSESSSDRNANFISEGLQEVFDLMRKECQIDFRHYKLSTVSRRIDRRMQLGNLSSLEDYIARLKNDSEELKQLYQDMLIGVTKFFRDPPCFDHLEETILPGILARSNLSDPLRIWVAGCATGEEAYSLAILLDEAISKLNKSITVKIFATDVHPLSLERAAAGRFAEDSLSNVSSERIAKYFHRDQDTFVIVKKIRNMVLFTPHNVLQDPPFTDLDMVSCRNLLIYFEPLAQRKALSLFHFGLKKDGVLFLGPSETLGDLSNEFRVIDERCKLYAKRREARLLRDIHLPVPDRPKSPRARINKVAMDRDDRAVRLEVYDSLLNKLMPPTLLVDDNRQVIESFGGVEKLLRFPPRVVSHDLLSVCPPALQSPLAVIFRKSQQTRKPVHLPVSNVQLEAEGPMHSIDLTATPLLGQKNELNHYAIQININGSNLSRSVSDARSLEAGEPQADTDNEQTASQRIRSLEAELHHSKDALQSTIEALEASNEELQATNEELISSNEELQSTNEELNSVNEELHTVNIEYQNKNAELREMNEDMNHLLASTDVGTIFLDEFLAIRRFTPGVAGIFDLQPHDIGRSLQSFSHTLDLPDLHAMTKATLIDGRKFECEVKDRFRNHYFLRILPYVIGGHVSGVIVTLTDIATLVKARHLAEKYQKRLQRSIDAVPVLVAYVNREQRYEYANQAYTKLLSKSADQIIGKHVREVIGEKGYSTSEAFINRVLQGELQRFETELDTNDGLVHLSVNYVPSRLRSGKVIGFYVSGTDVSSLKKAEREAADSLRLAQQANQAKTDFLAKMSHEIRSPMTSIIGFADILDEQLVHADDRDCVDVIRKNAYHLLELINEILDLSKIESGHLDLELSTFSPADLIRECYNSILPRADTNHVQLTMNLAPQVDRPFLGDRRRLRQVILNLLSNAVKFSPNGKVELISDCVSDRLLLIVEDNGCGIAAKDLPKVFDPFSQGDNTEARKYEGSGLGLTITKQLVERMNGSLDVVSELGKGSSFSITIPWVHGNLTDQVVEPAIEIHAKTPRLDGKKILVIDDRRDIRFIAEHILSEAGALVTAAESGRQGIDAVLREAGSGSTFDCIVTDIQMPEMDGFETTRRLRASGFQQPILALTASAMVQERDACLKAGCSAHLAKPINRAKLVETIVHLITPRNGATG